MPYSSVALSRAAMAQIRNLRSQNRDPRISNQCPLLRSRPTVKAPLDARYVLKPKGTWRSRAAKTTFPRRIAAHGRLDAHADLLQDHAVETVFGFLSHTDSSRTQRSFIGYLSSQIWPCRLTTSPHFRRQQSLDLHFLGGFPVWAGTSQLNQKQAMCPSTPTSTLFARADRF